MKKFLIATFICFGVAHSSAQLITPSSPELDFGEMLYMQPTSYTIEFNNNTNEPVEIRSVDTGCGCTAASFTQGLIQPHSPAQVTLTFDCRQLGHFMRNIRVFARSKSMVAQNPDSTTYSDVYIKGVVVVKKSTFADVYPVKMGDLLTVSENIEFDDVNQGQKLIQELPLMNPTTQGVQPVLLRMPPYLSAEMIPATLSPRQKGVMRITLNSTKLPDFGLNQTTIYLGKNGTDKISPDKAITVSAILLPPAVNRDDINRPYAPKVSLSKTYFDMSPLKEKLKCKDEIIISNNGRKPLEIQKLQCFTPGIEITLGDKTIESGGSSKLEVTCNAKDLKKLRVRPRILMITNDPDHQKVIIDVKE